MPKTALIAALAGLAAIVLVFIVTPGMRDAGFVVRAYVITAVIVAGYTWSLARRLDQAEKGREERRSARDATA